MASGNGLRTSGFFSLFSRFNKAKAKEGDEKEEGIVESLGVFTLEMDDDDFLLLAKSWEKLYDGSATKKRIHTEGDEIQRYWLGRQFPDSEYENGKRPLTDNIIFEAVETMIPQATQQNPESIVTSSNTEIAMAAAEKIHKGLEYLADYNHLKTKLKKGVRHWTMRFVGCWQIGWDGDDGEIDIKAINPKDLILDPNGYIDDGEYFGDFIGLKVNDTAENLITRFPNKAQELTDAVGADKMGSLITYVQWWTDEYVAYKYGEIVLFKSKNPHFNYNSTKPSVGITGQPAEVQVVGKNHFARPKIPFVFLTVFDLGDEPADKTGLIAQGLVTQDNINKRLKQTDRNTDNINGGVVVSGQYFNKEQAAQVAEARRQGRTIVVPTGSIDAAIKFPENVPLPEAFYASLNDQRARFLSRFGVSGSTAEGARSEKTVRGKVIVGNNDASRTGGGVSEYLELAAARVFNYWLQMIYVYWDTPHWISVVGPDNTTMAEQMSAEDIPDGEKFFVTVQNGSMVPQDELSRYNEAMSLWEGGALDPLSFYEKLKDPNPRERATKLMIYKTNPALYMEQFLQAPPAIAAMAAPIAKGGGGSEKTEPPNAVPAEKRSPDAVQAEESQLIKSVPEPKI